MNKEYWQDKHIVKKDDKFICYDEAGSQLTIATSREEARDKLEIYDKYILNNTTD